MKFDIEGAYTSLKKRKELMMYLVFSQFGLSRNAALHTGRGDCEREFIHTK